MPRVRKPRRPAASNAYSHPFLCELCVQSFSGLGPLANHRSSKLHKARYAAAYGDPEEGQAGGGRGGDGASSGDEGGSGSPSDRMVCHPGSLAWALPEDLEYWAGEDNPEGDLNPYAPYPTRSDYAVGNLVHELELSGPKGDLVYRFLDSGVYDPAEAQCHSMRALGQILTSFESGWTTVDLTTSDDPDPLIVEYRDILSVGRDALGREALQGHFILDYEPGCHADSPHQVYMDLNTGDWWRRSQAQLPAGGHLMPFVLSSDESNVSIRSGLNVYPLYFQCGNIAMDQRFKDNWTFIAAYIPVQTGTEAEARSSNHVRRKTLILHQVLELATARLREFQHR